jgi:hypothetical protein
VPAASRDAGPVAPAGPDGGEPSTPPPSGVPPTCEAHPELLEVPGAGSGTISGCAPKVCAGFPFAIDYPYLERHDPSPYAGCTAVTGTVLISAYEGADLAPLSCLERVDGDLVVWNSPGLVTLHGLESLALVRGQLGIGYHAYLFTANSNLARIDALSGLRAVQGDLDIAGDALTTFDGLSALAAVGGQVFISAMGNAPTLDLPGLNGLVWIGGDLELWRIERVARVSGFRGLRSIGGSFYVWGATELVDFPALPSLACITGVFDIGDLQFGNDDPKLPRIGPLPSLRRIGGDVLIDQLVGLQQVSLFDTLPSVGGSTISITNSPKLTTVPASALQDFVGRLVVTNDPVLSSCPLRALGARVIASGAIADFTGTPDCLTLP